MGSYWSSHMDNVSPLPPTADIGSRPTRAVSKRCKLMGHLDAIDFMDYAGIEEDLKQMDLSSFPPTDRYADPQRVTEIIPHNYHVLMIGYYPQTLTTLVRNIVFIEDNQVQ